MELYMYALLPFGLYILAYLFELALGPHLDAKEPPLLKPTLPLVGNVINLIYHGPQFYNWVGRIHRPPIFTLGIFGDRSYVVNSPAIIASIQRNSRTISFAPLIPWVAQRIAGLRPELCKTWFTDNGAYDSGMGAEHAALIHHTLYHPDGSKDLNAAVLTELKPLLEELPSMGDTMYIYKWVIHIIAQTSFGAVYGPEHPLMDDGVEDAFWDFENNAGTLLTSIYPQIQARTAYYGRKKLAEAFYRYYSKGNPGGSSFVTERRKLFENNGFTLKDIAQFEAGMSTPILSNTAPALIWVIIEVYSRPNLLYQIREELSKAITRVENDGRPMLTMDIPTLKLHCPMLVATYHECLRTNGIGTSARRVLQDTILADQYLVKKGNLIFMPFGPPHVENLAWGENPQEFDPTRHLQSNGSKRPAVNFRSFGGPPHLCPGRQVATLEILVIAAALFAQYDIAPVQGPWIRPKLKYTMSGIATPAQDIKVSMRQRKDMDGEWTFHIGDHKTKFALASN